MSSWSRQLALLQTQARLWLRGRSTVAAPPVEVPGCQLLGMDLANPLGMAAGIDRSGRLLVGAARCGFGFVELGSVTPGTLHGVVDRLADYRAAASTGEGRSPAVGVNLLFEERAGVNETLAFCRHGLRALLPLADYITLNPGAARPGAGRRPDPSWLQALLGSACLVRDSLALETGVRRPLVLKWPLAEHFDGATAAVLRECRQLGLDGVLLVTPRGLSGADGWSLLAQAKAQLGPLDIISVGGVNSPADASLRLQAGAAAVQLFSALLTQGIGLPERFVPQFGSGRWPEPVV